MSRFAKALTHLSLALMASVMFLSCDENINKQHAPVELIASVTNQTLVFDPTDTSEECPENIVVFELRNVVKQTTAPLGGPVDVRFLDIRLVTMRRRFVRTDGGTVVPRTVVQSQTAIVPASGEAAKLPPFLAFQLEMLREAPFVAIQSSAGGRDPETGLPFVRMEVITEFFGETLAGDAVSASATYPLTVCFGCGCAPKGTGG